MPGRFILPPRITVLPVRVRPVMDNAITALGYHIGRACGACAFATCKGFLPNVIYECVLHDFLFDLQS